MPAFPFRRPARELLLDLDAFLFPSGCVACRKPLSPRRPFGVCSNCRRRLLPVTGPTCLICRSESRQAAGFVAGRTCRDPGHAPFQVHAAVQMIDPADRLVHALKFHDRPEVGAMLAVFVARRLKREGAAGWDLVMPMPLHRTRERARGYNQSAEIAGRLALSLGARVETRALLRVRSTRPQADLDHDRRGGNVEGAFRAGVPPRDGDRSLAERRRGGGVSGRRCLLVDDVATTGHTLLEALRALQGSAPAATGAAVFALA